MRRVIKKLFRKPNQPYTHEWTMFSNRKMAQWKRNLLAGVVGTASGLWLGQYFPDIYFYEIQDKLPQIEALAEAKDDLQGFKPNQPHPRSNFEYPRSLMDMLGSQTKIHDSEYTLVNDVTKKEEKYKVKKVFTPEKREE